MNTTEPAVTHGINDQQYSILQSSVCSSSLYGLAIGIGALIIATLIIGYQYTGNLSLEAVARAHESNIGLRFLYLMPFVLAFWGQHSGKVVADRAGDLLQKQGNEMRLETSNWKLKSYYDATHDSLTDLPNRIEFYSRLKEAILLAGREDSKLVLMSLDLDSFKDVNEVYGNRCGDLLLIGIAERLRSLLSGSDVLSRTGGDEFSIFCTIPDYEVGIEIARRIHAAFETAFDVQDHAVDIKASIGIASYPVHGDTAEWLMQKAELAMHASKQVSHGYMEYNTGLKADSKRRVLLLKNLKTAIEEGGLSLHYQPKIDLKTRSIKAVEALVRWEHPEHGRISPEEFIPLAEQNRLIQPLSHWVIHTAIQQINEWHRRGINLDMAINISTHDLAGDNLPATINSMLDEMTIAPEHITLEITESSLMQDQHHARGIIQALSDLGLQISIDDFGTGYSSLAYLSQLSVDEIKIDQTFVMGMNERAQDATIVKATIDLAHNLGKRVTAEGIEDSEAMQRLCTWDCDTGQGYYFSPPMTASDLETWLRESGWQRRTGT